MRTVRGKLIPDSLDELVHPSVAALLLLDTQHYWPAGAGAPARAGGAGAGLGGMVPALGELVAAAGASGVLTILSPDAASGEVPDLATSPRTTVVRKTTPSAFVYTNLVSVLRTNGIRTVIVAGAPTSNSVATTAGDTLYHDFYPVVVSDCVADYDQQLHAAALTILDARYTVITSAELMARWRAAA